MTHLRLEELVSYFVLAQPQGYKPLQELDFVRLIEDIGLEDANEFKQVIVRQLHEGRNIHVILALLAAQSLQQNRPSDRIEQEGFCWTDRANVAVSYDRHHL